MGDLTKGTDNDCEWFMVTEADCVESLTELDDLFEESTNESDISNLIDDGDVTDNAQGNSLALFNAQVAEDCDRAVLELKRKYCKSPQQSVSELSPKLQAVHISPEKSSKRRLFKDSGIEEDETANVHEQVAPDVNSNAVAGKDGASELELLNTNNRKAIFLAKFKETFSVPYTELVRNFRSDKTCSEHWILFVFKVAEEVIEASKVLLHQHCNFIQLISRDFSGLYLLHFKAGKSRETILKLFSSSLNINEIQILCDPPKTRSVAVGLYFYKKSLCNLSYVHGPFPDWLAKLTLVDHQIASAVDTFDLSQMIQWAYDNHYTEEPEIAYFYALAAEENTNAAAFLRSNSQLKHVRDCAQMVKLYLRQEMKQMSIAEWIYKCCDDCSETNDWKNIVKFLKYQEVNFISFLITLKIFFKGIPKKNCVVFYGPPDTGKSYFVFAFMRFIRGKVISFVNRGSHFWLQPLMDTKVGFLDDATHPCWEYIDINLRNALDGNSISIDSKHRAPVQLKLPPLCITTNCDVKADNTLLYLHSRLECIKFPNKMPFADDGKPLYEITDNTWASFFRKFGSQLELIREEDTDGDSANLDRSFRCTTRGTFDSL